MKRESYAPMELVALPGAVYEVVDAGRTKKVFAESPAIDVMTDLRLVAAATIAPETPLAEANQAMILRGVRSLFVVDSNRAMIGMLSATDLLGETPVKIAAQRGMRPTDLSARDLMTPIGAVEAVSVDRVMRAEVGHVVATLKRSGRQHLLVVQTESDGKVCVRGLFSASQIARQLGIPMHAGEVARTFAEIEAALAA